MAAWAPPWRGGRSGKSKWSCSCGTEDNYATRKHCRGCGAKAPRRPITFKEALLGPTKREVAMQKKLDARTQELTALRGSGKVGKEETVDGAKEAQQVDLARHYKWAQACKSEWGENSEEYKAAFAKYQAARAEKDNAKPPSVQLTQAKHAREKLEKEVEASANDASWYEQQLEEARAKYEKKKEQLQIAKAKEQELRVQECGVRGSPEFLKAMQRQLEDAIDGSGVTKEEHQQVFDPLGKVMANAKQEDVDMAAAVGAQEHQKYQEKHYPRKQNSQSSLLKSRNGSGQENHLNTDKLAVVTQSMKAEGYLVGGSAAVAATGANGEPGTSAGVAVAVPKRVGMSCLFGKVLCLPPVYLWTVDGMTYRNTQLTKHVIGKLKSLGVPWVIGGDFQVAPEAMANVRSVQVAKATVVTANAACGTCRHAHGNSEIDYFVVANSVIAQVGRVAVQETRPAAPRRPVRLTTKLKAEQLRVRVLEKPRELPEVPIGRVPAPPRHADVKEFSTQMAANTKWAKYMQVLKREAFQVRGMKWEASDPRAGRAEEPTWRVKPLTFGGANVPTAARAATWWRWAARTLRSLQGAHQRWRKARERGPDEYQKRKSEAVDQQLIKDGKAKWADTLEAAAAGAAGRLRKMSKAVAAWRPRRTGTMAKAADTMEAAEFTLAEWKNFWRVGEVFQEGPGPWVYDPRDELDDYTEEDVSRLKMVARTIRTRTGIGVDRWHPSMLQGASGEAYHKLLDVMREVERALRWPIHMGTVLFFITPKTFTTYRVIGFLPATMRIWEITREPYMTRWAKENQMSQDCTSFGKAAEDQGEELEATITAVLDLIKAFERVSLFVLWEAGKQLKFNTGVLAVVCSYVAMARRLIVGESVSSATGAVGAIIAGSKFSVCFLKLVIQSTVDGLVVGGPRAKWRMYVDDLCVRLRQQQQCTVHDFSDAIDACFEGFGKLGLKFSVGTQGKGAVLASTKWVRKAAAKEMNARGLPVVRACPYLGVDLIANGTAAKTKCGKRCNTMLDRSRRPANLKGGGRKMAKGTALVFKCGLKRSVLHGCKCLGMPDHQLRRTRREAGQALPGGRGAKTITLQLALANEGPTYGATEAPIVRWARAVREESSSAGRPGADPEHAFGNAVELLMKAWKRLQQGVGMKPMWARVRGPAGAVVMSLKRAQWAWPAWHAVITKDGYELDMREVCPMGVAAMRRKDAQQKLWQDWTAADECASLRPAPMVAPAVAQLKARDFPKHANNAARKAFIGGSWTMSKLCECNTVPEDICLARGEAVGTPHHRHFKCQALRERRLRAQPEWQTGQYMCQTVEGDGDYFTGDIVCDGSKIGYSEWAQTGWAATSINENGMPKYQMWGPLPCTPPVHMEIKRAEMSTFYQALERKPGKGNIYTDHRGNIEGLQKGGRWCISWKRPHADIWKRIWHKVRDLDLDVNGVYHVKAHRSKAKIEQLTGTEPKVAKGSAEVDLLAKAGAELDANYGRRQTVEELAGRVHWAALNIGWWHQQMEGEWPD
ncbi:unnamed protein product, partial [Prorocentrum cordatum]